MNCNGLKPFLKYAGGKQKLLSTLKEYIPSSFRRYYEPFVGGGAFLFYMQPKNAVINDINGELINCYRVVKNNVNELINDLGKHINNDDYFYKIREIDRTKSYQSLSSIEKASRTIFLNKTCFNGVFRVNRRNQFNVPYRYRKNPNICDKPTLLKANIYLNENSITIRNRDFAEAVKDAGENDFIYFDPPYDPISETSDFTRYTCNKFNRDDHQRLKKVFDSLSEKGCKCLLSNSFTPFIQELYGNRYNTVTDYAPRSVNRNGKKREKIPELLIMNYIPSSK